MKVSDHYKNPDDFKLMLETAKRKVSGSKEEDFVNGLEEKFSTWGPSMFLSEAQSSWLCDIACRS